MVTKKEIAYIRLLRKERKHIKTISLLTGLEPEVVEMYIPIPKYKLKKKRKLQDHTVIKIREEYDIMLQCDYPKKYIREELSRWYGVPEKEIQKIVLRQTYKDI